MFGLSSTPKYLNISDIFPLNFTLLVWLLFFSWENHFSKPPADWLEEKQVRKNFIFLVTS